MKKISAVIMLFLIVLTGCGTGGAKSTGGCSSEGPLKVLSPIHVKDSEEAAAWSSYVSDKLGYDVELTYVEDEYDTYVKSSYSSDLCYDVIYTTIPDMMSEQYALPLDDVISSSDILSDTSIIPQKAYDNVKQYSNQDQVYGIPNKYEGNLVLIYRGDWLKEFGMDEPTNLDEWHDYMVKAHDKYGAYGFSSKELYDIQPFMSTQGIQYGLVQDSDGKWTVPYASDDAAKVYDWLGDLYDEGLYEPNLLTNGTDDVRNALMSGNLATMGYWDTWVGLMNDQVQPNNPDFLATGAATMTDSNGNGYTRAGNPGVFIVNKNTQKLDQAGQFLDFMHSADGDLLTSAGIPDVDYTMDGDKLTFTDEGLSHGADHGVPRSLNQNPNHPYTEFQLTGADEASAKVSDYGFIPTISIDGVDYFTDMETIINKYAIKSIIEPDISGEDAVASIQKEIAPTLDELNS